jgi:segregation and condensation protein B
MMKREMMAGNKTIKSAIESMMFVWGEPLNIKVVADIFNVDKEEIYDCCRELQAEYEQEGRGIVIREVNKSFQFVTRKENLDYIERLCTPVKHKRLSQSALETLAIIAYKQPVTKGEIESIRGIRCDRVMEGLIGKNLVAAVGRSDSVGRPILYGTTDEFLKQFEFESLKELPEIDDIEGFVSDADERVAKTEGVIGQMSLDDFSGKE